jgi:hypothetical protein
MNVRKMERRYLLSFFEQKTFISCEENLLNWMGMRNQGEHEERPKLATREHQQ